MARIGDVVARRIESMSDSEHVLVDKEPIRELGHERLRRAP
jgi:hypothetical protein